MSGRPYLDAVVIGAGPYGLSVAAHLIGRGRRVGLFGQPFALWRDHTPHGMLLRSASRTLDLSDPCSELTLDRFARDTGADTSDPLSRATFIAYGLWFQQNAVPTIDPGNVWSVEREAAGFTVQLADGRRATSAAVVVAVGLRPFAHRPALYDHLPHSIVSHSTDHGPLDRFRNARVIVVGGGQSAVDYAALLRDVGATVYLIARRPIEWRAADVTDERCSVEWLARYGHSFYQLPQWAKDRWNRCRAAGAAAWMRDQVVGKVVLHQGRSIVTIDAKGDAVVATISDGTTVRADHVLLATGFDVRLDRLLMLGRSLRGAIRTHDGAPLLSPEYESSVSGLYFCGAIAVRSFGPICQSIVGCGPAARTVARAIASRHPARSRSGISLA